jgi:hypothetical protein
VLNQHNFRGKKGYVSILWIENDPKKGHRMVTAALDTGLDFTGSTLVFLFTANVSF